MSVTGKRMQERRKQLGVSADVLAEHLGVSRSTIFRYENGDIEKVPANLLSNIAKFLRTSERFLMGWEDSPETISSVSTPPILNYYEQLNDLGKHEATKRVMELTEIPRYIKDNNTSKIEVSSAFEPHFINANEAREYLYSQKFLAAFEGKIDDLSDSDALIIANEIYINNNTK